MAGDAEIAGLANPRRAEDAAHAAVEGQVLCAVKDRNFQVDLRNAQNGNGRISILRKAVLECLDALRRPEGEIHDGAGSAVVYLRNTALRWTLTRLPETLTTLHVRKSSYPPMHRPTRPEAPAPAGKESARKKRFPFRSMRVELPLFARLNVGSLIWDHGFVN